MDDFINFLHDDKKIAEILDHFPATIKMDDDNISNFLFMFGKKIWGEEEKNALKCFSNCRNSTFSPIYL